MVGITATLILATGCSHRSSHAQETPLAKARELPVLVVDEAGSPIVGATIEIYGLRPNDGSGGVYGFHRAVKFQTDAQGRVGLEYPANIPDSPDQKPVASLDLQVEHPEFCTASPTAVSVQSAPSKIQLIRGLRLEVSGYFGPERQPVRDLIPTLNKDIPVMQVGRPDEWREKTPTVLEFQRLSSGDHVLQLRGRLASGDVVYSEAIAFSAEKGKDYRFDLELKRGVRLEGRLDDRTPRPVKNGWVYLEVRPPLFPDPTVPGGFGEIVRVYEKYGRFDFWRSYRPLDEQGQFVFESVPPGEIEVIAFGDGFVSTKLHNRDDRSSRFVGLPQTFPQAAPTTSIEVLTEPTAPLEVTVKGTDGRPLRDASVAVSPNIAWANTTTAIFGRVFYSDEEPFREMPEPPRRVYWARTDQNGACVIPDVPSITRTVEIRHPALDRGSLTVRLFLSPGIRQKIEVTPTGAKPEPAWSAERLAQEKDDAFEDTVLSREVNPQEMIDGFDAIVAFTPEQRAEAEKILRDEKHALEQLRQEPVEVADIKAMEIIDAARARIHALFSPDQLRKFEATPQSAGGGASEDHSSYDVESLDEEVGLSEEQKTQALAIFRKRNAIDQSLSSTQNQDESVEEAVINATIKAVDALLTPQQKARRKAREQAEQSRTDEESAQAETAVRSSAVLKARIGAIKTLEVPSGPETASTDCMDASRDKRWGSFRYRVVGTRGAEKVTVYWVREPSKGKVRILKIEDSAGQPIAP
jgi:hypothetical protein